MAHGYYNPATLHQAYVVCVVCVDYASAHGREEPIVVDSLSLALADDICSLTSSSASPLGYSIQVGFDFMTSKHAEPHESAQASCRTSSFSHKEGESIPPCCVVRMGWN